MGRVISHPPQKDYSSQIASGEISGSSHINKFGKELITAGSVQNVDIVGNGNAVYVPPTADRIHQVKSTLAADTGTLVGTYTSTTFDLERLIDTGATFITDGVAIGDTVVNDTNQDHSMVISIDSEIQLTLEPWHHSTETNLGHVLRIGSPASTGAVFLHIRDGEKKGGAKSTEFILLNGTTNVPTVNEYFRIVRAHIHGAGSNKKNLGKVTATADVDSTVTAIVLPNQGQTLMAFIHVPYGKRMLMKSFYCSMFRSTKIANAMADIQLMSNLWGSDSEQVEHSVGVGASGGVVTKVYDPPKVFSQGTDVWIRSVETTDTNSTISAGFDVEFENL